MMPLDTLVASALGELEGDADREVEEHILACGECAERYTGLLRLGPAIGELVRSGGAFMPVPAALVRDLEAEGLVTRRYTIDPGGEVACTVGAEDVYTLVTYHAELSTVSRVDLIRASQRMIDVPFDPSSGRVFALLSGELLRQMPSGRLGVRLVSVDEHGDRVLADYTLNHTAFVAPAP